MTEEQINQMAKDVYIRCFDDDFEYSGVLHALEICVEETATVATKELQEEIEKLKYKEENYLQKIEHKDEVIETLKKCIEKMKSCSTCENSDEFGKCFNLLKVCRECVGYSNWQLKELAE